jgi:transmembrane sensor
METKEGNNMDDLLVKKMLGEATVADLRVIDAWLARSAENRRYHTHFELIWSQSKNLADLQRVDENAAWDRFKARVGGDDAQEQVIPLLKRRFSRILSIAAVLVVIAGAGWLTYLYKMNSTPRIISRSGEATKTETLQDGSVVILNYNSSLSYPAQFKGDTREVALTGEGFFEVTPDKKKPFIIKANGVTVRVVGTSFNIKTTHSKTEVVVETGLVEVSSESRRVHLKPRQQVTVSKDGTVFTATEIRDVFHNYYRTRKLVCDNTPLWRLVEILNEIYGVKIEIRNELLKHRAINTTFDELSLDATLILISDTFNIKVIREGKQIILQ